MKKELLFMLLFIVVGCVVNVKGKLVCEAENTVASLAKEDIFVFRLTVNEPIDVAMKVYDMGGRYIRTLFETYLDVETNKTIRIPWNLRDYRREYVKAGRYILKVCSGLDLVLDEGFGNGGFIGENEMELIHFIEPQCVRVDERGMIYVLDNNGSVYKLGRDGSSAVERGSDTLYQSDKPILGSIWVYGGNVYGVKGKSVVMYSEEKGELSTLISERNISTNDAKLLTGAQWCIANDKNIFVFNGRYGMMGIFDLAKSDGADSLIWKSEKVHSGSVFDSDGLRWVYYAGAGNRDVYKGVFEGGQFNVAYSFKEYKYKIGKDKRDQPKIATNHFANISGIAYDGENGIFIGQKEPTAIVRLSDSEFDFQCVKQFFANKEKKYYFYFISGLAFDKANELLYVLEDGVSIDKGGKRQKSKGASRLSRYKIKYTEERTIKIEVR